MNKKISVLAIAVGLALTGCGGSDGGGSGSSASKASPTVTNRLIDSAVSGLYYQAMPSGQKGYTTIEGNYTAKADDTITFYLGGPNGLKVGAASNRDVITPFEAAGKYNRALNLAIILQSLDEASGDDVLTVPAKLKGQIDSKTAAELSKLKLDDRDSVNGFLANMGVKKPVSEEQALQHMGKAFGSMKRGAAAANPFALGSNKVIRYIDVSLNKTQGGKTQTFVHADKTLKEVTFNNTRGMTSMNLRPEQSGVRELKGSNDHSLNGDYAEKYLTCDIEGKTFTKKAKGDDYHKCDSLNMDSDYKIKDQVKLSNFFSYSLIDKSGKLTADKKNVDSLETTWLPFSAKTIQDLNTYKEGAVYDDSDDKSGDYQYDITSGSYDAITGVYTEIVKKVELKSKDKKDVEKVTERVAFYYPVSSISEEKYVDFTGTWVQSEICADGQLAEMKYVFNQTDVVVTGSECRSHKKTDIPKKTEKEKYADAANGDMWWFNQAGRVSKASLTELNTVVRLCDQNNYKQGDACPSNDEYFVKWEYQPAGKNWDQGLLIRRKMDKNGKSQVDGGVSIMQKIN